MSTTEDYFSIDDILSAEPRFFCTFRVRGHQLGHLDPIGVQASLDAAQFDDNGDHQHIPPNHRLPLPFWLAETLAERNFVTLHMPHCFKKKVHDQLRADANSVLLGKLCSTYYTLGIRVAKLVEDLTLPSVLMRAYANRCWRIVDNAPFTASQGAGAVTGLDSLERSLYFTSHSVNRALVRWKERKCDRIVSYESVLGKRPAPESSKDDSDEITSPVTPPSSSRVRVH